MILISIDHTIQYIKGIGPQKSKVVLEELGIEKVRDLLYHFPFRYVDRSIVNSISEIQQIKQDYQFVGKVISRSSFTFGKKKKGVQVDFSDGTGTIKLIWYQHADWVLDKLTIGTRILVFGKVIMAKNELQIAHPEISFTPELIPKTLMGVYSSTEKLSRLGLDSNGIRKIIQNLFSQNLFIPEVIPDYLRKKFKLLNYHQALLSSHFPKNEKELLLAKRTLKFNELLFLQLELRMKHHVNSMKNVGYLFEKKRDIFNEFYTNHLPFELTNAQKRVVREIHNDIKSGSQMNRLIQGDVGSGKTLVALLAMLIAIDAGYQTSLMAPTEILAQQHFQSFKELLGDLDIKIELLIGSLKNSEKLQLIERINNGDVDVVIGTHALIEERVQFKKLGLAVIDEQHRFGVEQRARMWKNSQIPPHILVMTATPIPRTLAMTLYGDLDVSIIDELPPGRKPIVTKHYYEKNRLQILGFVKSEIEKGRQIYIVYPLIEESSALDFADLQAGYEYLCNYFQRPQYQISIVHGKLKPDVKDFEMQRFIKGETQIMVATTVIEVGVNVPNASVMIIESAERFGLSQLHQLRGRVGRGSEKSYCILVTKDKISAESRKRMNTMVATNDGFEIAEVDMELRGPGDIMGTQQSGIAFNLKVANLATDGPIVTTARKEAMIILKEDPALKMEKNLLLFKEMERILREKPNWSQIS